jgi:preprotein translocase subunit SecD
MSHYPKWKMWLFALITLLSAVYAMPILFGSDPAVQVTALRGGVINEVTQKDAEKALELAKLDKLATSRTDRIILIRLPNAQTQLRAQEEVRKRLGDNYAVALHSAPRTPEWLSAIGARPLTLGLDLRGGVHFTMEMREDDVRKQQQERFFEDVRSALRDKTIRDARVVRNADGVVIEAKTSEIRADARAALAEMITTMEVTETARDDGMYLLNLRANDAAIRASIQQALETNLSTLRNRINDLGVAEPIVQQQGLNRVVVQLPGVQDSAGAKKKLATNATLEYRAVDETGDINAALEGRVPPDSRLYYTRERPNEPSRPILLKKRVIAAGDQLIGAQSAPDPQSGTPAVSVNLNSAGGQRMLEFTRDNVGKGMAVVFIEDRPQTTFVDGKRVDSVKRVEEVISVARIQGVFSNRFQTTGLDSTQEANDLAQSLKAGSLAAPMAIVEERTVGPSMGQENIDAGFKSVIYGFVFVMIFMVLYYKLFGVFGSIALIANVVLLLAILAIFNATLTLPGIAGIVLTVGMAIDANVLIYERIREELRLGMSPMAAIKSGFEKAFGTIADSNITTLIAGIVLFSFGTGPIKGFAVVLSVGILTSMFTAIIGTRTLVALAYSGKTKIKSLSI